jgi:hypothetical protein
VGTDGGAPVTSGYFDAVELAVVRGRTFTDADGPDAPPVAVVDTRLAERLWPGEDAVGKRVRGWGLQEATVVGVVDHVRNYGVLRESREELYMPHGQRPYIGMWLFVRTEGDPAALADAVRREVSAVLPDVPVSWVSAWRWAPAPPRCGASSSDGLPAGWSWAAPWGSSGPFWPPGFWKGWSTVRRPGIPSHSSSPFRSSPRRV